MTKYATLEQMQEMEFGASGQTRLVEGGELELLTNHDGSLSGWVIKTLDVDGNLVDWDRLPEIEATQLMLWPQP